MTRVTIKDVAREVGVSTALVSVVLNARRREDGTLDCDINKDTAARVLQTVERLGYKRNRVAAGLRSGKSYLIGLITPDIANKTFAEIGRSIEDDARQNGYVVMYGSSEENAARLEEVLDAFIATGVDGLVIIPCAGCEKSIKKAVNLGIPTVLCNRDIPEMEGVGRVSIDHVKSTYKAVDLLYDNGYRKIELISEDMPVSSVNDREKGYVNAMTAHGLTPLIHRVSTEGQHEETIEAVRTAGKRGTDAIVAVRIMLSFAAIEAIQACGYKIPEDLAFIGADDSPVFQLFRPTISSLSHSSKEIGHKSFSVLLDMIEGKTPYNIILEPKIHIGDSSGKKTEK